MNASVISSALEQIDQVGAEGELDATGPEPISFDLDGVADPVVLPDGKRIYPPRLFGEPIDEVACRLIDTQDPAASRFMRLIGPPGVGKALATDTPIATPTGWSTMGDLKPGDEVLDEQGVATRVLAATGVMHDRECFEVEFSDGSILTAGSGSVANSRSRRGTSAGSRLRNCWEPTR